MIYHFWDFLPALLYSKITSIQKQLLIYFLFCYIITKILDFFWELIDCRPHWIKLMHIAKIIHTNSQFQEVMQRLCVCVCVCVYIYIYIYINGRPWLSASSDIMTTLLFLTVYKLLQKARDSLWHQAER